MASPRPPAPASHDYDTQTQQLRVCSRACKCIYKKLSDELFQHLVFVQFPSELFDVMGCLGDLRCQTSRITHLGIFLINVFHFPQSLAAETSTRRYKKKNTNSETDLNSDLYTSEFLETLSFEKYIPDPDKPGRRGEGSTCRPWQLVVIAMVARETVCHTAHLWSSSFCSSLLMSSIFCCRRFLLCSGGR